MHDRSIETVAIPPEQQALRDKCFHPWGTFVEFPLDDVETSISSRFEKIARMHPDRIAVKLGDQVATYAELNAMANRVAFSVIAARGDRPEPERRRRAGRAIGA
jgi:non-ribosomal peptide synthetase component F